MAAIIREDAAPLPETSPAQLRWIIERLLSKEPADRYDSTRDLYRELKQIRDRLFGSSPGKVSAVGLGHSAAIPRLSHGWVRSRVMIAAVSAAILGGIATWAVRPETAIGQRRFTPVEVSQENPSIALWSPDGKAFIYGAGAPGQRRVWLRYITSPTATPLTRPASVWGPAGWSPDGKRVIVAGMNPAGNDPPLALFAIPVFGGEPEVIMPLRASFVTISRDGWNLAIVRQEKDRTFAVYTASPPGAELKRYAPAPFETKAVFNNPNIRFSPNNRFLLYVQDVKGGRQVWKLPYPPGSGNPYKVMKNLTAYGGTPMFSLFPGERLCLTSLEDAEGEAAHLWIVGLNSGNRRQLTDGSDLQVAPSVSPDGKRILYGQAKNEFLLVSASLADASVEHLILSEKATGMPAWGRGQEKFVYTSDRAGSSAVWMRAEGWDRPLVTVNAFPRGSTVGFMTPALSPDGNRLIYTRIEKGGRIANWISSVSGGPSVRLTDVANPTEYGGSWSPDGRRFAFITIQNANAALAIVKTSGDAAPVILDHDISGIPEWSPDGQWISFPGRKAAGNWTLLSPDGKLSRAYSAPGTVAMTFSADSKLLYGIRTDREHRYLYSYDPAARREKVIGDIGQDFTPRSYLNPGIRLSLSPDGQHILFPTYRSSGSLWMLEGFQGPTWAERLRELLPW